jgi:propanol-preferring alcohol dehydrogenase
MKAAVLREFKTPLSIEEVPQPQTGAHDVLIAVEACGVCHSDLHLADNDWPQLARIIKKPLILGHEIAGRILEKGSAVENLQVGDRVGIPWLH